jgi:hypothetical protein
VSDARTADAGWEIAEGVPSIEKATTGIEPVCKALQASA